MYSVIISIPKNKEELKKKYTELLADAVSEELTHEELGYLISEFEKRENVRDTK
ncbi:hypothetical protein ACJDU8_23260 [Clostridium sp. WILCCON 0269]|uniref:CopG family transcriptional regulator n=1 Tax=Candidatus Clostridium eludens TaxID=3381663 RepID=A0ABW8SQU9_9CLOT